METQQVTSSKILSAREVRERAVKSRKERVHQKVGELDNLIAAAIESAHVDTNEVVVQVGVFAEEVVQRTISRLIDADYRVQHTPGATGLFAAPSPPTLKISWSE